MHNVFKCDCGTHLLEIGYEGTEDWNDIFFAIYDVYNPKTGRKYRKPKCIADVVIMNNAFRELNKLIQFFKTLSNQKKIIGVKYNYKHPWEKELNKSIKIIKEDYKIRQKENKKLFKKNKKKKV